MIRSLEGLVLVGGRDSKGDDEEKVFHWCYRPAPKQYSICPEPSRLNKLTGHRIHTISTTISYLAKSQKTTIRNISVWLKT